MKVIETKNYDQLSRIAAQMIGGQILLKPDSVLGLATGSSPIGTYKHLITQYEEGVLNFSAVRTVNLDEYCGLTQNSEHGYRYFMNHTLFNHVNIDLKNTFVPMGNAEDPEQECLRYEKLVADLGGIDLQILGIGHNGHIGFNEPSESFPSETHIVDLAQSTIDANSRLFDDPNDVPRKAITMGIGTIIKAKKILLIAGSDKREIVEKAIYGKITPEVPASVLQLHRDVTIIISAE
ncbi:glucosamine-6-phosphate deaminase [Scatolibacter rhodanostii]|uniref:glucosamine-6-phosphate deaminase n=1 Tax=Scatolibacter rhodanostii TaxID=2014781 RepID=UPI000C06C2C2|nr:glucosamine-6-phosphate deaminase [Scatolibacter rhodanostii]